MLVKDFTQVHGRQKFLMLAVMLTQNQTLMLVGVQMLMEFPLTYLMSTMTTQEIVRSMEVNTRLAQAMKVSLFSMFQDRMDSVTTQKLVIQFLTQQMFLMVLGTILETIGQLAEVLIYQQVLKELLHTLTLPQKTAQVLLTKTVLFSD